MVLLTYLAISLCINLLFVSELNNYRKCVIVDRRNGRDARIYHEITIFGFILLFLALPVTLVFGLPIYLLFEFFAGSAADGLSDKYTKFKRFMKTSLRDVKK